MHQYLFDKLARHLVLVAVIMGIAANAHSQDLERNLLDRDLRQLVEQCEKQGDAIRGALIFFQPQMACNKCHRVDDSNDRLLGPNLATIERTTTTEALIESVLQPSKAIQKGYESVTLLRTDGSLVVGHVEEQTDALIRLREATNPALVLEVLVDDVEAVKVNSMSLMPAGQVNQLADEQQFFDLIKYLTAIRDGGIEQARKLQPSESATAVKLPEYEAHVDHAGLIEGLDEEAFERGAAIYRRVCQSCHGTASEPGSLPTSLRFAQGKFKNGSDPYAMYQTLTRGYGFMTPQAWMVPSQKYDVIHYIREAYLREQNPSQYAAIDQAYLDRLPQGDTFGPEPSKFNPWDSMNYGPMLSHTLEIPGESLNIAYKGVAVQLDQTPGGIAKGKHWVVFDTDTLRVAGCWSAEGSSSSNENFIDWRGIQFNGEHGIHPTIVGSIHYANAAGPGWANAEGDFHDNARVIGRDGRRYGPLPRQWAQFHGTYQHGDQVVFSYSVQGIPILEMHRMLHQETPSMQVFERILEVAPHRQQLLVRIADGLPASRVRIVPELPNGTIVETDSGVVLQLAASETTYQCSIQILADSPEGSEAWPVVTDDNKPMRLSDLTRGGIGRWKRPLVTKASLGENDGPFAVDTLTPPESNPWDAQLRLTGLDFMSDGRIAVCTWDGDVWLVQMAEEQLTWKRIASGLFQPLGLKVIDDTIYLTCRDQLAILRDYNGDEEVDFIECLNNDHQVTEHFHEFAMGLQTDDDGNFYYAKSARHALPAVVPHHGTLLRVAKDGSKTDILANGFRAANGVCMNPDGSFVVTDQEGHWNPKNRINWVTLNPTGKPKFYGNMFGYTDQTDASNAAMEQPLCWITNAMDRSPAELLWVDSKSWGALDGSLLNLSYGYGKVYLVPHETNGVQVQGGMIELPIPQFPTGIVRGRFNPADGHLYVCGMYSWAGSQTHPGGLYRIRATGRPLHMPVELHAIHQGMQLKFSEELNMDSISPKNFHVKVWSLQRTKNYGSDHIDERELQVLEAKLAADRKTIELNIDSMAPTWCMEIVYDIESADGQSLHGKLHNTVHFMGP